MPDTTRIMIDAERIEPQREGRLEVARHDPRRHGLHDAAVGRRHLQQRPHGGRRHGEGAEHRQAGHGAGHGLRQPAPDEGVDQEPDERQQGYQDQHARLTTSSW